MPLDNLPAAQTTAKNTAPGDAGAARPHIATADEEETAALLNAVRVFSAAEIGARRTRPEHALTAADFSAIGLAAQACGLVDGGRDGYGLWSTDSAGRLRTAFTLQALQIIAADDAAAAWHLHGVAMAQALAAPSSAIASNAASATTTDADAGQRSAQTADSNTTATLVFCGDGSHGLGRSAFGRWLTGMPAAPSDDAVLADVWGTRTRLSLLAPGVAHVMTLRWHGGGMHLETHALENRCQTPFSPLAGNTQELRTLPHGAQQSGKSGSGPDFPHGLDGCHAVNWTASASPLAARSFSATEAATCFALQQLAQVAIARGALQPAAQRAHAHSQLRKQGACVIAQHDAVAQLLADIEGALLTVDALLAQAVHSCISARQAFAIRRDAMPLLARAANAAMQVHGGSGYLRDTGLEHIWRAINVLRVMGGSSAEAALIVAAMDDAKSDVALPAWIDGRCSGQQDSSAIAQEDHLPGHLPASHPLSPRTAFRKALRHAPLLHLLSPPRVLDAWERDTRSLPASLAQLRRRVRHFALAHCAPIAAQIDLEQRDAHTLSPTLRHLLTQAGREGLLTDILPAPIGSAPITQFRHALALQQALRVEELARLDGGLMLFLSAHNLGLCPLLLSGDLRLLNRVVRPAFRRTEAGDPQVFAFAITEPAAGSDAEEGHGAAAQTPGVRARRAQRSGESGWLLRGRKIFISGGDVARYIAVFSALENEGYASWTCFLVDTHSAGFSVARCELKSGMRASGAAEITFDDCFVPDNCIVGGVRNGWALARATLNLSRLPVAAMAVGFAQQAVDIATDFACRETLAGRPLVHYQQVQSTLADLQAETGAIRQLLWHHARQWRVHQDAAALCKFQATDRAQVVVETAMDLMGNAALCHANRIERTLRDVRLTRIFEGTNQINRLAVIEEQQPLLLAGIAGI